MLASPSSLIKGATSAILIAGDVKAIGTYFAQNYVAHVTEQDISGGHALIRTIVNIYRKAFTDLSVEIDVFLESADTVAWRRTLRAKQTGAFKGFPGTGAPIIWQEILVTRVADGRIAEEWIVTDLAERLLLGRKALSSKSKFPTPLNPSSRQGKA